MPVSIYMASGDEFIVTSDDYAAVARLMQDGAPPTAEFHALWYTDPEHEEFDEGSVWPAYREQRISICTAQIVAVEDVVGPMAQSIARAMKHAIDEM